MRNLIRTYSITGDHEITITGVTFAENDVRLIVNETQNKVLVSSMQKANVVSVSGGVITLASTTASLVSTDVLTIEIDQAFSVDTSTLAKQGTDSTATNTAILQAIEAIGIVEDTSVNDTGVAQSVELAPNKFYRMGVTTAIVSTLTLTLGTPISGMANEYHFSIVCGSTAPTINFPSGISWNGGSAPTIAASKTYEVSIMNNIALFVEI